MPLASWRNSQSSFRLAEVKWLSSAHWDRKWRDPNGCSIKENMASVCPCLGGCRVMWLKAAYLRTRNWSEKKGRPNRQAVIVEHCKKYYWLLARVLINTMSKRKYTKCINHILLIIMLFQFAKTVTTDAANHGMRNFLLQDLKYSLQYSSHADSNSLQICGDVVLDTEKWFHLALPLGPTWLSDQETMAEGLEGL